MEGLLVVSSNEACWSLIPVMSAAGAWVRLDPLTVDLSLVLLWTRLNLRWCLLSVTWLAAVFCSLASDSSYSMGVRRRQ